MRFAVRMALHLLPSLISALRVQWPALEARKEAASIGPMSPAMPDCCAQSASTDPSAL